MTVTLDFVARWARIVGVVEPESMKMEALSETSSEARRPISYFSAMFLLARMAYGSGSCTCWLVLIVTPP